MAVAFRSVGASATSVAGSLAITAPACQVNDVMIAFIQGNNNNAITTPAGWTIIQQNNNTAAQRFTVAFLNAISGSSGAVFTFTSANDGTLTYGAIICYSGAIAGGVPYGTSTNSANASSATITWATLTPTTKYGNLIVALAGYTANGVTDGGIAGTDPSFVNRFTDNTAAGTTAALLAYDGVSLDGAATGARTVATGAAAAVNDGVLVALNDASGGNASGGGVFTFFGNRVRGQTFPRKRTRTLSRR